MEHEQQTVHYVTQDAMPNLKLRVTLTLLSAARSKPTARDSDQAASSSSQPTRAAAAADGQDTAQEQQASTSGRQEPFKIVRTFSWQEKVYSKAELVAAQAQLQSDKQRGKKAASPSQRAARFGSQAHINTELMLSAPPEGSILFSYVQTDEFCERFEASTSVTTSRWERRNHLARKLVTDARNRQQMLNFQSMCIMADLGDETTVAGSNEKVLCVLRAHHDGSFDMSPGFNAPTQRYRFEDDHGSIYEYALELASQTSAPSLEKHTTKLAGVVAEQAEEMRRQHNKDKLPVPGPDANALRLVLLAELVSAAGFTRDRLYIDWQLHFDPELWILQHSEQEVVQPGVIQGVTHVSQMVQYPPDPSIDTPAIWVAHFAHPIEVEWVARAAPHPKDWPKLLLQVCTYDLWDRMTTEGYGWLQLGPANSCCSNTQYVDTWKPLGSRRDQQQEFFIGGSEELQDLAYMAVPKDHKGQLLNKYGYKTQTSGNVKVRTHMVLQAGAAGGSSPSKTAAKRAAAAAAAARQRRSLSLAIVLERARSRLEEARGGEVVVRGGLLVQPPTITAQPADAIVNEGTTMQMSVKAVGLAPLRFQWFRDSKRLTAATSNSPLLVLVDVAAADSGSYHCQVTNKDGTASSVKALLTVNRLGRLQALTACGASAAGSPEPSSSGPAQGVSLSSTLARRTTIPRTIPVGGSPSLPFTTRLASTAGAEVGDSSSSNGGTAARGGTMSPLRTSLALGGRPPPSPTPAAAAAPGPAPAALPGRPEAASAGRTGLNVPLRRFAASSRPSTAPAADGAAAAAAVAAAAGELAAGAPVQAADVTSMANEAAAMVPLLPAAVAAAATGGGSAAGSRNGSPRNSRRVSGGWFAAAEGSAANTGSAAQAAQAQDRAAPSRRTSSSSQQSLQQQQHGAAAAWAGTRPRAEALSEGDGRLGGLGGRSQSGSSSLTGSPARQGSMRRSRVSEQEQQ